MPKQIFFLFMISVLSMAGCSFTAKPPETKKQTGLIEVRPSESSSAAVLSLLKKARAAAKTGQLEVAEAQLERALRIEPRNASLWHYMAKLRLKQGQLEQAAELAARSNNLQRDNQVLQADNWRIIAHAHNQQGNIEAARKAQSHVDALMGNE